ncbi:MAG TPA: HAD family hydrolase [Leptolinea sp.]
MNDMSSLFLSNRPILAFDMDGTLLSRQDGIHSKDIDLLTMPDPPAIFVPATGRSLFAIRRILQTFGINRDNPLPYPLVLQNGSLVYNPGEEKIRSISFSLDIQEALIAQFKKQSRVSFLLFSEDRLRMLNPTAFGIAETRRYMFQPEDYTDSEPAVACSKILCLAEDPVTVAEVNEMVKELNVEVALSKPTILEFNPPGVNKGEGLEFLAEFNGWNKERIFCAGDGDNDVEMFRRFENSFTPDNSPENIQQMACYVIDTQREGLLTPMLQIAL